MRMVWCVICILAGPKNQNHLKFFILSWEKVGGVTPPFNASKEGTTNLPISETETFSQFGGFLELHTTQGTTFKPIGDVRRVVFQ